MKLHSKYLEGLRIRPDPERRQASAPACDWPGCERAAQHPAPKGRDREGEYFLFCLEHVRQYNKRYNYFSGMADEELRDWLERNVTGHRPTWRMCGAGGTGAAGGAWRFAAGLNGVHMRDAFGLFGGERARARRPKRTLPPAVLDALNVLGLDESADAAAIKARYKKLVKELHPDVTGGCRQREARLREVIAAYHNLRKARLV